MSLDNIKKTFASAPIVKKGEYNYIIHPLIDGIPAISPEQLREIIAEMKIYITPHMPLDKIVTIEAMGIPYATLLSIELNIPLSIIRKRKYGLPEEIHITQRTGYATSDLYLNGLQKGEDIVVVDDLISTGGTLRSVLNALQSLEVNIKAAVIVCNKGYSTKTLSAELKVPITSLIDIKKK